MKIAINKCYGGFSISDTALHALAVVKGVKLYSKKKWGITYWYTDPDCESDFFTNRPDNRTDPDLIEVIEQLGCDKASGSLASLKIVEIPDDVEYTIEEYDGIEWIAEVHRTWR